MKLEDRIINQFHNSMDVSANTIEQYTPLIAHASEILLHCLVSEKKILCVGNGGSASLAQHFCALLLSRFRTERPGLPAICLSTDGSTITAVIEDINFSDIYSKQISALGQPGDVLLLTTTHGKSSSLVQAIQAAHDREMMVIVLNGGDGGDVTALLRPDEVEICVPSHDNSLIHNTQLLVLHCLCDLIDFQLFGAQ
ncbi:MAG: SIS domain-containing protein [Oceanospirillaceae bacterium]|nr:SIS domain-containing protein [Oceanospirillaceae bacterium]